MFIYLCIFIGNLLRGCIRIRQMLKFIGKIWFVPVIL